MRYLLLIVVALIGLFIAFIINQESERSDMLAEFKAECERRGGIMILDRNKVMRIPHCFARESVISIER